LAKNLEAWQAGVSPVQSAGGECTLFWRHHFSLKIFTRRRGARRRRRRRLRRGGSRRREKGALFLSSLRFKERER
jgi:hypothetical protein